MSAQPGRELLERIFELYDSLEQQRIMLSFKGDLSPELITALLNVVERKLERIENDARMRRKVFNVAMECLQNLYHHHSRPKEDPAGSVKTAVPNGVLMVAHHQNGYSVLTGNFMAGDEVDELRTRLEHINALSPDELRDLYKQVLNNGRYSDVGGGGLGMIDIARRSGRKLEFGFVPFDQDNAFFSLNVNVTN